MIKSTKQIYLILQPILIALVLPGIALAAPPAAPDLGSFSRVPDLGGLATNLMDRIPVYLGALATIAIIYSGGMYVLALGDANKTETAKKNLTWTIIGIIAASTVFIVIRLILAITSSTVFNPSSGI